MTRSQLAKIAFVLLMILGIFAGIEIYSYIDSNRPKYDEIQIKMQVELTSLRWYNVNVSASTHDNITTVLAHRKFDGEFAYFQYLEFDDEISVVVIDAVLSRLCKFKYSKDKEISVELQDGTEIDVEKYRTTAAEFKSNCFEANKKARSLYRKVILKQ